MASWKLFGGTDPTKVAGPSSAVVIGLGRFGSSLALKLMASGTEVLGVGGNEEVVQEHNGLLTHVVRADSTREASLRQLNVQDFPHAVVAIGSDIQANILTSSLMVSMGVADIWAKAVSDAHGAILDQIGVHHVVYPEKDMGRRVAHLVRGRMQDFVDIGDGFALVRTKPQERYCGKPLGSTDLRRQHGVTVVGVKPAGQGWRSAEAGTILQPEDIVLVTGPKAVLEDF